MIENGTSQLLFLLMRGFGTGAIHIVCGAVVGYGLLYVWERPWGCCADNRAYHPCFHCGLRYWNRQAAKIKTAKIRRKRLIRAAERRLFLLKKMLTEQPTGDVTITLPHTG